MTVLTRSQTRCPSPYAAIPSGSSTHRSSRHAVAAATTGKPAAAADSHAGGPDARWPEYVLTFDTETTVDAAQALLFGCYRFGRWRADGTIETLEEGLVLRRRPRRDGPSGWAVLQAYAAAEQADTGAPSPLRLRSRRAFVNDVLWHAAYKARALVVGFNLPFDLSRIAVEVGDARGSSAAASRSCSGSTGTRPRRRGVRTGIGRACA